MSLGTWHLASTSETNALKPKTKSFMIKLWKLSTSFQSLQSLTINTFAFMEEYRAMWLRLKQLITLIGSKKYRQKSVYSQTYFGLILQMMMRLRQILFSMRVENSLKPSANDQQMNSLNEKDWNLLLGHMNASLKDMSYTAGMERINHHQW